MHFEEEVNIPKETIAKFGRLSLPTYFKSLKLIKNPKLPESMIVYDLILDQEHDSKKIGDISVLKTRMRETFYKEKTGALKSVHGDQWQIFVNMEQTPVGMPRYGDYGMTMAMMYTFMQKLDEGGIDRVVSLIEKDNAASVGLFNKTVGVNQQGVLDSGNIKGKIKPGYVYVMPVDEALNYMMKYKPNKGIDIGQILKRGRS